MQGDPQTTTEPNKDDATVAVPMTENDENAAINRQKQAILRAKLERTLTLWHQNRCYGLEPADNRG
jgi:hypothetical protein